MTPLFGAGFVGVTAFLNTMREQKVKTIGQKKDWALDPDAFDRLLNWLDEGINSGGKAYLEIRQRLVAYFDRKKCLGADDLADQTLNRVARRLEEEGLIESETPARYCYIVARFVFLEHLRRVQKDEVLLDDLRHRPEPSDLAEISAEKAIKEKILDCLEKCIAKLDGLNRDIILQYYIGKERVKIENRRKMADNLGISINALTIRACRIREKLETCVRECSST